MGSTPGVTDHPHVLTLDGEPQTGTWHCARCGVSFQYAAEARGYCRTFPWGLARRAAFYARVHACRRSVPRLGSSPMEAGRVELRHGPV